MAVGIGAVTTGTFSGVALTTTISFTSTSQPLYVVLPLWLGTTTITGVTYGGTALTRVAQSAKSNANDRVEIWRLLAPSAGTANVVVTTAATANTAGTGAIFNTTGQDTGGTPEGTAATNAATVNGTATGSLSVSGAASGDLVIVGIAVGNGAAVTPSNTGGSGLTEFMDVAAGGEGSEAFRVSDACTAVSGSWTGSTSWAIAEIPLKTTGGGATPAARRLPALGVG